MAKRKQSKNRKQVKRQTRHFQLRVEHPQDAHVREVLDYARSQRREVTVIREAVALFWALENGNLDALFEKFPQYKAQLTPPTSTPTNGAGGSELAKEIAAQIVLMGGTPGILLQSAAAPALPAATGKQAAPPVAEVKQSTASVSADTIADNFLSAFS